MARRRSKGPGSTPKASKVTVRYADGRTEIVKRNHFQRGSPRTEYERYLRSPHWRQKRKKALERDGYACVNCESKDRLEVHHITYERVGDEALEDLRTLCQVCHSTLHQLVDEGRATKNPDSLVSEDRAKEYAEQRTDGKQPHTPNRSPAWGPQPAWPTDWEQYMRESEVKRFGKGPAKQSAVRRAREAA